MKMLYDVVVLALMLSINFVLDTKCKCDQIWLKDNLQGSFLIFNGFYFFNFEKG